GRDLRAQRVEILLSKLVDQSLVEVTERGGHTRYRLLETVRKYATDQLDQAGECATFRRRHREHYRALAHEAEAELHRADQEAWFDRLEEELGNLRTALQSWLSEVETAEIGLRMLSALRQFWVIHGHFAETRNWLERFLKKARYAPVNI